jgi:hypothetical protein
VGVEKEDPEEHIERHSVGREPDMFEGLGAGHCGRAQSVG